MLTVCCCIWCVPVGGVAQQPDPRGSEGVADGDGAAPGVEQGLVNTVQQYIIQMALL